MWRGGESIVGDETVSAALQGVSKGSFKQSFPPSFCTTQGGWGEEVYPHRHDSSLQSYLQDNSSKSQLRPSHLFFIAEYMVVRCRN